MGFIIFTSILFIVVFGIVFIFLFSNTQGENLDPERLKNKELFISKKKEEFSQFKESLKNRYGDSNISEFLIGEPPTRETYRNLFLSQTKDIGKPDFKIRHITDYMDEFNYSGIPESYTYEKNNYIFVIENGRIIIIQGKEYNFKDIINYSLFDNEQSKTVTSSDGTIRTSTGDMLGRAVVGGVLTGGLGAVAGAATAKKNLTSNSTSETITTHDYIIFVNINSLSNPTVSLNIGSDQYKANKIINLLNVIVEQNKKN